LIIGFDPERAARLQDLFATSRVVREPEAVRQAEWDVIVTREDLLRTGGDPYRLAEKHLYVLAFGGQHDGDGRRPDISNSALLRVSCSLKSVATEFEIPQDLPAGVDHLITTDLLPWVQQQSMNFAVAAKPLMAPGYGRFPLQAQEFLRTTAGEILACSFRRYGGLAESWLLPTDSIDILSWTKAAISHWHTLDSKRFPFNLSWRGDDRWRTPSELSILQELAALAVERDRLLAELSEQEDILRRRLSDESKAADENERLLLSGQGEPLVRVVSKALEACGFAVQSMDEVHSENDRREDLRITTSETGWQ
jgi:hypothetical protein